VAIIRKHRRKPDVPLLFKLWNDKRISIEAISITMKASKSLVTQWAHEYGLPPRTRRMRKTEIYDAGPEPNDPLPHEIEERARIIREGWDNEQRAQRAGKKNAARYRVPMYQYDEREATFTQVNSNTPER
jgi:hypothetical protein